MTDDVKRFCPEAVHVANTDDEITAIFVNTFGVIPIASEIERRRGYESLDYGMAIQRAKNSKPE